MTLTLEKTTFARLGRRCSVSVRCCSIRCGTKTRVASKLNPWKRVFTNASETIEKSIKTIGVSLLTVIALNGPVQAEQIVIPPATNKELYELQLTTLEAWAILSETYVDPTFNHLNWGRELEQHMRALSGLQDVNQGRSELKSMLSELGDPYTRWVPSEEYAQFRVSSDGELKGGVGLLIASDPAGNVVVLSPIAGSPAAKAGIQSGDRLISVNGSTLHGINGEEAAQILRGDQGSSVEVEVERSVSNDIPGAVQGAGMSEDARVLHKKFRLRRERVQLSPIFATTMNFDDHLYGYIRLVSFSSNAASETKKAVEQLRKEGCEAYILDLRGNPGGLVTSSLEVANVWMDGREHPAMFSIAGRESPHADHVEQQVVLSGPQAISNEPLIVLVNQQSASASEILAGALKDNGRAKILGDRTFGKGKIQSVFELRDGSALFVTVAMYKTPNGLEIDRHGIDPDLSCRLDGLGSSKSVAGVPVAPGLVGADGRVMDELETDACIQTAETILEGKRSV